MSSVSAAHSSGFAKTQRRDKWWFKPLLVFFGFSAFIVYSTWSAFQGDHYTHAGYLSPFYSPELFYDPEVVGESSHAWFGPKPGWWPGWMPFSPALLILWAPGGFRFTCYYYRGAYYKSFWADPPACSVGEARSKYLGENSLPLILQNVHRYFLYVAIGFLFVLTWDAYLGFWFPVEGGGSDFGIGVGSLVLVVNVILLSGYTLGCHSFRHLVGGFLNVFSRHPIRKKSWDCITCLNARHQQFAWFSLFWVGFTDVYVRLCSHGVWTDWRLI